MDLSIFQEIGLTKGEIKVYISLLEEGTCCAGDIIKKTNIPNSAFHYNINRLINKGLVSYTKKNKFKLYNAADPINIIEYLKDKENKVKELIPKLKEKQKENKEKKNVEIYEGYKGIITLLQNMIIDSKKGDEFLFFPPQIPDRNKDIQNFYRLFDMKRKVRGLITKGIVPSSQKEFFKDRKYLKIKYTNQPIPSNKGICNNKFATFIWGEKPIGVLIISEQLSSQERKYFTLLWNSLK
jgi:sugar-specific transcriptional regulator TrmB